MNIKSFFINIWTYLCNVFDAFNSTTLGNFILERVVFRKKSFFSLLSLFGGLLVIQLSTYFYQSGIASKLDEMIIDSTNIFEKIVLYIVQFFIPEGNIFIIIILILLIVGLFWDRDRERRYANKIFGDLTITQVYEQWVSQTKIKLEPNLVLISREEQIKKLIDLLSKKPSKIIIHSLSEQESYAFIFASLKDELKYSNRIVIINNQESWNNIIENEKNKILVYQEFTPNNIGLAIEKKHFVIEAQESINIQDKSRNIIELPRIKKSQKVSVLEDMGFDHTESWKIYNDTKGFLHAIVNHPLLEPYEKITPRWVDNFDIDILSSILFINSWNRTNNNEIKILEILSGVSYAEFEKQLHLLSKEKYAPIRLVGNVWQVISKINLWDLIANKISITQIDKLKPILLEVFGEIDPAYELNPKDRMYASMYNKNMKYSPIVRNSLSDTLALISVFGNNKITYTSDIRITISYWLRELFELNINVESWYSFGRSLSLLAEASPKSFLEAIEKTLNEQSNTKIEELFEDAGDMGGCFHCDLLWALEKISWNIELLPQVILILARLNKLDIKSKMSNHPFNTLRDIFLGWINYSNITYQEKLQIIENILYKKHPDTTWKLLIELLPNQHSITSGIEKPKYQIGDEFNNKVVTRKDAYDYYYRINHLLIEYVKTDIQKWNDIFNNIDKFYENNYFQVIDIFITLDKSLFTDDIRLKISKELRDKIHKHRKYLDSDWSLPKEWIDKLELAFIFIEPDNLIDKYSYLFDSRVNNLNPIPYDRENGSTYKLENEVVDKERDKAISEIIKKQGFDEIVLLIDKVSSTRGIGRALFNTTKLEYKNNILKWLDSSDDKCLNCAKEYVSNITFIEDLFEGLNDKQKSEILLSIGFNAKTFEILKKQNLDIQKYYWNNLDYYYSVEEKDERYIPWIIEQFTINKKYMKAIDFLSHSINKMEIIDSNSISKILLELNPNEKYLDFHSISEVIKFLQKSNLDSEEMRGIEWKYLQMKNFEPITLEKEIINNSKSFVELVSFVYKAKNNESESEYLAQEEIISRANNAKELLDRVSIFSSYDDIDSLSVEKLRTWIKEARNNFKNVDRVDVGDMQIGKLLSKSKKGKDDIFPCEITREILEEFSDGNIGKYFIHGKKYPNGSRFTTKAFDEGGEQEYALSDIHKKDADSLKFSYPKTSSLLRDLADGYKEDAKSADLSNELN